MNRLDQRIYQTLHRQLFSTAKPLGLEDGLLEEDLGTCGCFGEWALCTMDGSTRTDPKLAWLYMARWYCAEHMPEEGYSKRPYPDGYGKP